MVLAAQITRHQRYGFPTAAFTYVGPDAMLDADATQSGNSGSVVVWGNQGNNFAGDISARGGTTGGNGGLVETSAHNGLHVAGQVDASAANGKAGTCLLDPYDVTIASGCMTFGNPFTATSISTIEPQNIDTADPVQESRSRDPSIFI
jgi:fibronectin-binding autotransporter adhesin